MKKVVLDFVSYGGQVSIVVHFGPGLENTLSYALHEKCATSIMLDLLRAFRRCKHYYTIASDEQFVFRLAEFSYKILLVLYTARYVRSLDLDL